MLHYKTNHELLEEYNRRVEGHIDAKKALINLVNRSKIRHKQRFIDRIHKDYLIEPLNCLLIGSSGSGKTFLVETLRDIVEFPLLKVDATKFNPSGAGDGGIKSSDLAKMIRKNASELVGKGRGVYVSIEGAIAQTVVFCDEIDKLATKWESSGSWNSHVQANFLTLFEDNDEFAGVSFIFAGAFTGIEDIKTGGKKNDDGNSIGFHADLKENKKVKDSVGLDEKIIKMGLIPELVGRISSIVALDVFTKENYRDILLNHLVPKKEEEMIHFNNGDIGLTEEVIETIITKAMDSGQGVRFLKRELDAHVSDVQFDYELHPSRMLTVPQLEHWTDLISDDDNFINEEEFYED